jgi:hypothetical protein
MKLRVFTTELFRRESPSQFAERVAATYAADREKREAEAAARLAARKPAKKIHAEVSDE